MKSGKAGAVATGGADRGAQAALRHVTINPSTTSQGPLSLDVLAEPLGWLLLSLGALPAPRTAIRGDRTGTKFSFRSV
jgi:hypothetical protein